MADLSKSIAKKLKSSGLKRLRWYCTMCEKQCRDENGFRNHCTTDNHLRNMDKFSTNANRYVEDFSRQFEKAYLDVLSRMHHTKRMNANYVYNELIQDKDHIHMSATQWNSLASFVKYLGDTGKCEVDEDERGLYVRWIDPEELRNETTRREKQREEDALLSRRSKVLLSRQEKEMAAYAKQAVLTEQEPSNDTEQEQQVDEKVVIGDGDLSRKQLKMSNVSSLFQEPQAEVQEAPPDSWLMPDVVVRIASSKVGNGKLKNEKAVVVDVHSSQDTADLILIKSGEELFQIPSRRLENLIPASGNKVMVLGLHRRHGEIGVVVSLDREKQKLIVKFPNDEAEFDFKDVSKLFDQE